MRRWALAAAAVAAGAALAARGGGPPASAPTAARGGDWPRFHGPRGDNISTETGLLRRWPPDGPKRLWTAEGIGAGYASVAVADGVIYTTGNIGEHTVITALDLDGAVRWRAKNGPAYRRSHPGTRSTPTIDGGRLYHENADGDVVCLDARTGREVWAVNILKRFDGRNITWGLAESLLVDGDRVICTPGGKTAGIVALHKDTGRALWVCKGPGDKPGYCSPVLVEHKGRRQIVTLMARSVVGVDPATGELLWRYGHRTAYDEMIVSPIVHDGCVFFSTSHRGGAKLLRLTVEAGKTTPQLVWHNRDLDNQQDGVVLVEGYLYGSASSGRTPWMCLDFRTGETMYAVAGVGRASATVADGRLYALSHRGTVALIEPDPRACRIVSRFRVPRRGRGPAWAHPVVCGGRLYVRHGDVLHAYDVRAKGPRRDPPKAPPG